MVRQASLSLREDPNCGELKQSSGELDKERLREARESQSRVSLIRESSKESYRGRGSTAIWVETISLTSQIKRDLRDQRKAHPKEPRLALRNRKDLRQQHQRKHRPRVRNQRTKAQRRGIHHQKQGVPNQERKTQKRDPAQRDNH